MAAAEVTAANTTSAVETSEDMTSRRSGGAAPDGEKGDNLGTETWGRYCRQTRSTQGTTLVWANHKLCTVAGVPPLLP